MQLTDKEFNKMKIDSYDDDLAIELAKKEMELEKKEFDVGKREFKVLIQETQFYRAIKKLQKATEVLEGAIGGRPFLDKLLGVGISSSGITSRNKPSALHHNRDSGDKNNKNANVGFEEKEIELQNREYEVKQRLSRVQNREYDLALKKERLRMQIEANEILNRSKIKAQAIARSNDENIHWEMIAPLGVAFAILIGSYVLAFKGDPEQEHGKNNAQVARKLKSKVMDLSSKSKRCMKDFYGRKTTPRRPRKTSLILYL